MNRLQFISLLAPALGSVVLVILAWINSNVRIARPEAGQDQPRVEIEKTRSELRSGIGEARSELRSKIVQVRGEVAGLRDVVYREMVSLHERIATVEAKNP